MTNIRDGKLRALAVLSTKRAAAIPDVPTAAEAGIPGHEGDTLTGIVVPGATPKQIVERLNGEIQKLVALPDVKEKLETLGFVPVADTPAEFGARINSESAKWAKVINDAKIKID
jgi:tripartite-type tricarboxylate transporter receptor subunit TctC